MLTNITTIAKNIASNAENLTIIDTKRTTHYDGTGLYKKTTDEHLASFLTSFWLKMSQAYPAWIDKMGAVPTDMWVAYLRKQNKDAVNWAQARIILSGQKFYPVPSLSDFSEYVAAYRAPLTDEQKEALRVKHNAARLPMPASRRAAGLSACKAIKQSLGVRA